MTAPKRVLILGAETELGAETARALAAAGHVLALIASTPDPEAAFAVQRLARKLNAATSQAIDSVNEMAVRVMVRQVAKQLGGLDAAVMCANSLSWDFEKHATRQMEKTGAGLFINVTGMKVYAEIEQGPGAGPPPPPSPVKYVEIESYDAAVSPPFLGLEEHAARIVRALADHPPTP